MQASATQSPLHTPGNLLLLLLVLLLVLLLRVDPGDLHHLDRRTQTETKQMSR